jgi:hypothetical protein
VGPDTVPEDALESQLIEFVARGGMLTKHTRGGRGRPHPRFFVVDPQRGELAWGPAPGALGPMRWRLVGLSDGPSPRVASRAPPHSFSVSLSGPRDEPRELDLVAPDAATHSYWTRGLRLVLLSEQGALQ